MSDDSIERFEELIAAYSPDSNDYSESIRLVNKFFDDYIISNIKNCSWNIGVKIAKNGSQVFSDQQFSKKIINLLYTIVDNAIDDNIDLIKDGHVVVFDNSIKDGKNIRKVLNKIIPHASQVDVAVLLSRVDTLEDLKLEYPKVQFHSGMIASKDNFSKEYFKKIQPYLDIICSPIQRDHPLVIINFDESFNEQNVIDIFSKYGYIKDEESNKVKYVARNKKLFGFGEGSLQEIPVFDSLKFLGIIDKETILEDIIILRIYIREGHVKQLIIQPIILEGIMSGSSTRKIDTIDSYIKTQIICQFLLTKILNALIKSGMNILQFSVIFDQS